MKKKFFVFLFIIFFLTAGAAFRPSVFASAKNHAFGGADALYAMLKEERENAETDYSISDTVGRYSYTDGVYSNSNTGTAYAALNANESYSALSAETDANGNGIYPAAVYSGLNGVYSGFNTAAQNNTANGGAKSLTAANSAAKRLIVKAKGKINYFGAAASVRVGGFYILRYADKTQAEKAYAYFSAQKNVESVGFDTVLHLAESENPAAVNSEKNSAYPYTSAPQDVNYGFNTAYPYAAQNYNSAYQYAPQGASAEYNPAYRYVPQNTSGSYYSYGAQTASAKSDSGYRYSAQKTTSSTGTAADGRESYSYLSWGASAIGADVFSSYLAETFGIENLPEVVVATADSGVDTAHPVFSGRILSGGKNFSTSEASAAAEYKDDNGHGTHVAGIIADLTLKNVKILPLKVINSDGAASVTSIIAALSYLSELKAGGVNVRAVNLSLSGAFSQSGTIFALYKAALENAYVQNILPVAAAGNDGQNASGFAPGNIACVLTVSGVKKERGGAYAFDSGYSNFGTLIDFAAPGTSVQSAWLNGSTSSLSGTSMAAPHVSAVAALLFSNPNNAHMTSAQAEAYLKSAAIDLGKAGRDNYYGYGLINTGYAAAPKTTETDGAQSGTETGETGETDAAAPSNVQDENPLNPEPSAPPKNFTPIIPVFCIMLAAGFYLFTRGRGNGFNGISGGFRRRF
ncbi:MAG: S8 family serine peptidase [Clostridiales bacterium]|jgi:subtilisin family serine protease|nr:S8 family serine peptidase [Clostridiales bacterium]